MTDKEIAIQALEKAGLLTDQTKIDITFAFNIGIKIGKIDHYLRGKFLSHSFAKAFWGEELITMQKMALAMGKGTREWEELEVDGIPFIHSKDYKFSEKAHNSFYCNQIINLRGIRIMYMWQYHLQQIILEENPLKYLERFL